MILITGSAHAVPGARERLIVAAREVAEATQNDPGCISYTFAASLTDDSIISIELWRDREALEAHLGHEHTRRFLAALDGLIAGAPVMSETEL